MRRRATSCRTSTSAASRRSATCWPTSSSRPSPPSPEMPTHAWQLGIAGLNAAYAREVLGPEAVLQSLLEAIAADTRGINAFCHLDAQAALEQARASAQRWQQGRALGPLDGEPVSIRDLLPVAGWPTRGGSRSTAGAPPAAQDAPLVAQLRAAGAVLFGKTSTTE